MSFKTVLGSSSSSGRFAPQPLAFVRGLNGKLIAVQVRPETFVAEIIDAVARHHNLKAHKLLLIHERVALRPYSTTSDSGISNRLVHLFQRSYGQLDIPSRAEGSMLGYTSEDELYKQRALELLGDAQLRGLTASQFCQELQLASWSHEVQLEALLHWDASALCRPRIDALERLLLSRIDRDMHKVASNAPLIASTFVAAVPLPLVLDDLESGQDGESPLATSSSKQRQTIRTNLDFMNDQVPSLDGSTARKVEGHAWSPCRVLHPSFKIDPCSPSRPAASPQLVLLARQHLSTISTGRVAAHDFESFDAARFKRRSTIASWTDLPASWTAPLDHDAVFPEAMHSPVDSLTVNTARPLRCVLLTTFPVSNKGMQLHPGATEHNLRLAKTAVRVNYLFSEVLPCLRDQTLWLDSNPCARPASERTTNTPRLDDLFGLLDSMLENLDSDLLWVQMDVNWENMMARAFPTHVAKDIPSIDKSVLDCQPGKLDKYWSWSFDLCGDGFKQDRHRYRPITRKEMALWAYHNLLDLSTVLPLSPASIFVRNHQGSGRNRVMLFTPHICTLDQIAYNFSTFEKSLTRTEAAAVSAMLLSEPTSATMSALDDITRSLSPGSNHNSRLRLRFSISGLERKVLTIVKSGSGRLEQLKCLRREEIRRRLAFRPDDLSEITLEYAAHHLLDTNDVADFFTGAYQPRPPRDYGPPSIVHDLLSHYRSLGVHGMAQREKDETAGTICPRDQRLLDHARNSAIWHKRLEEKFGSPIACDSRGIRFFLAAQREKKSRAETRSPLVVQDLMSSIQHCGDGAVHYWTMHGKTEHSRRWGQLRSLDQYGRVPEGSLHFKPYISECEECLDHGHYCMMTYRDACIAGFVTRRSKASLDEICRVLEKRIELIAGQAGNAIAEWRKEELQSGWTKLIDDLQMLQLEAADERDVRFLEQGGDDDDALDV